MPRFYDPLTERWHAMYQPKPAPVIVAEPENDYVRGARLVRQNNIWDAVVSSATSSRITA
jgi:hypothetical protein